MSNQQGVVWLHQFVEHLHATLIEPDGQNALLPLGRVLAAVPPPPTIVADFCARQLLEGALLGMARRSPEAADELVTVAANLCEGEWTTVATRLGSLRVAPSDSLSVANRAKQYLDRNYRTPCRLIDVARGVGASTRRVTKEFSASYGCSIHQYLITVRLKIALDMLSSSAEKITFIASAAGFGNVSVLYRHFDTLCGASPGFFRGSPPRVSAAKARIENLCAGNAVRECLPARGSSE